MIVFVCKGNCKALFLVWNARLPIESEFVESVRVLRCQRLLMFEHVERLDGRLDVVPVFTHHLTATYVRTETLALECPIAY